jgi:hypothetical protein
MKNKVGNARDSQNRKSPEIPGLFADRTGLEPATSAVTGRHSNQLNYRSLEWVAKIRAFCVQQVKAEKKS